MQSLVLETSPQVKKKVSGFGFKSKMLQSEMEVIREKDSRLSFSSDEEHSPIYPDALNSLQSFRRKGSNPLIK